jgi:hypothetical protein
MLLSTKNGIRCDKCGLGIAEKFTYYSFDIKEVVVTNNSMSFGRDITYSFDICQRCMEEIKATVIKCYKPTRIINNKSCPTGIFCDFTSTHMHNNFICYYICVSIIAVNMNQKPCSTVMDDKYLELWICKEAFEQLRNKTIEIQNNKENQEWSSKSVKTQ